MLEAVDGSPHTLEEVRSDAPEAKQVWLCPKHDMHAVWTPADHFLHLHECKTYSSEGLS